MPTPTATQYLVRVHATAITAKELTWAEMFEGREKPIPGHDVSGVVMNDVGGGGGGGGKEGGFKRGDEVFGLVAFERDGAAAEYFFIYLLISSGCGCF